MPIPGAVPPVSDRRPGQRHGAHQRTISGNVKIAEHQFLIGQPHDVRRKIPTAIRTGVGIAHLVGDNQQNVRSLIADAATDRKIERAMARGQRKAREMDIHLFCDVREDRLNIRASACGTASHR
jgi:hypothetical protein